MALDLNSGTLCLGSLLLWRSDLFSLRDSTLFGGNLPRQGLYLATTSNSSFFYVFTVMHALHLLGGIAALTYLIAKIAPRRAPPRWSLFEGAAIYWHFMGVLWLYLLVVIATQTLTGKEGNRL